MKKYLMIVPLLSLGFASAPTMAAPGSDVKLSGPSMVEKAQGYHRDCAWVNNKWTYRRGDKMLVCRPHRPEGRSWTWRREGPRVGWYDTRGKNWHHNNW